MALALGLGSLFNHSDNPNVQFSIDTSTESIRYTTTRRIEADEELCIFYGHKLWFHLAGQPSSAVALREKDGYENDDSLGGLDILQDIYCGSNPFKDGDPSDILQENELPFERIRVIPEDDSDDIDGAFRTILTWVVDVPDPRSITDLLKWMKSAGLETPELQHLKRIRRVDSLTTILLATASTSTPHSSSSPAPSIPIPANFLTSEPYTLEVPASAALTIPQVKAKSAMWPTIYAPKRKGEPEKWTRAKAAWAWDAVSTMIGAAEEAGKLGELPIASYVPASFVDSSNHGEMTQSFVAYDTRRTSAHPLRHSVMNVVRKIADWRASSSTPSLRSPDPELSDPTWVTSASSQIVSIENTLPPPAAQRNGSHYLLTSLTLFTTHEPCVMCSMALLHSRVKEIIVVVPMDKTGGCGGSSGKGTCVPRLKAVNHRFGIAGWKIDREMDGLTIDEDVDA
ncbi:hypothetical protein BD410DRAFT_747098 [Rickenella mellea]|uniref:SET domain-containing protein n=1 Tax=Rickenella mellea TaxID=50990 RepID=A0A4Y7Q8I7_9AGAM|nr:hypothetical protein BD410DRAFT_747098 [Rickenella mellea]